MKINNILVTCLFVALIAVIFTSVFVNHPIAGGDYLSFWPEQIHYWRVFSFSVWDPKVNLGWGITPLLSYSPYSWLIGLAGSFIGNNVIILERVFWWIPFFVLGILSPLLLIRNIFGKYSLFFLLAPLVFLFNTYIIILVSGGQISGIGLAYSIAPLVLLAFVKVFDEGNGYEQEFKVQNAKCKITFQNSKLLRQSLLASLLFAVQVMFDLRIAYITFAAVLL